MKYFVCALSIMLLAIASGSVQANHYIDGEYATDNCGRSYECSCNPLYCGAIDLQLQGGVNPIKWRNRGDVLSIFCAAGSASIIGDQIQSFSSGFKTPWIIGGQLGYHWSDNVRTYVEFNYSQAKTKTLDIPNLLPGQQFLGFSTYSKYKVFDAYVGARYYWNRWCDRTAFFLGAKVGLTHHKSISGSLSGLLFGGALTVLAPDAAFALSNTVVSGGADFGFDVCLCGNWAIVITGSVLASCGPQFNPNLIVPTNVVVTTTNLVYRGIGTELRFPVTAGIRYSF